MDTYNSIIFDNFLQPVTSAIHSLVKVRRESSAVKTNEVDSDWILSGIVLTVVMFECAMRWTHFHCFKTEKAEALPLYEKLRALEPALPDVREAFVLRNAIAHGHLWSVPMGASKLSRILAWATSINQNSTWKNCVDADTGLTVSGLHVIPTQMTRHDFKAVIELIVAAMIGLVETRWLLPQAITHVAVWPGDGTRLTLPELPSMFK